MQSVATGTKRKRPHGDSAATTSAGEFNYSIKSISLIETQNVEDKRHTIFI
jgi:hypothetical protein